MNGQQLARAAQVMEFWGPEAGLQADLVACCWHKLITALPLPAGYHWSASATNSYVATYVLAFITAVFCLLTFLALILYRRAVQDKERAWVEAV